MFILIFSNFWISSNSQKEKEFEDLILSIAISDIYFSNYIINFLLSNYFFEDMEYFHANERIQTLLSKVICVSRPKFLASNFIPGLQDLDLDSPLTKIRSIYKIYAPTVRAASAKRIKYLKQASMSDSEWLKEMYMTSLTFWGDIVELARTVDHSLPKEKKKEVILEGLRNINKGLPSFVFIPSASKLQNPHLNQFCQNIKFEILLKLHFRGSQIS